jgi:hypothetical protein
MSDVVSISGFQLDVENARGRQTPENDFGSMVKNGLSQAGNAAAGGARALANVIPGGALITAVADGVAAGVAADGSKWALLDAQEKLQQEGLSNSLKLLALQRKMQEETEAINLLSNIMKSRHELAKAAINNLR